MEIFPPDIIQLPKHNDEYILRVIYLCHPYRGEYKGILHIILEPIIKWWHYRQLCRWADRLRVKFPKYAFVSTVFLLHGLRNKKEEYVMQLANFQIKQSDELWILHPIQSRKMKMEVSMAHLNDVPVKEIWTWNKQDLEKN